MNARSFRFADLLNIAPSGHDDLELVPHGQLLVARDRHHSGGVSDDRCSFSRAPFDPLVPCDDRPPSCSNHGDPLVVGHVGGRDGTGWTVPLSDDAPRVAWVGYVGTDTREDVGKAKRVGVDVVLDGGLAHFRRLAATHTRERPSVRLA